MAELALRACPRAFDAANRWEFCSPHCLRIQAWCPRLRIQSMPQANGLLARASIFSWRERRSFVLLFVFIVRPSLPDKSRDGQNPSPFIPVAGRMARRRGDQICPLWAGLLEQAAHNKANPFLGGGDIVLCDDCFVTPALPWGFTRCDPRREGRICLGHNVNVPVTVIKNQHVHSIFSFIGHLVVLCFGIGLPHQYGSNQLPVYRHYQRGIAQLVYNLLQLGAILGLLFSLRASHNYRQIEVEVVLNGTRGNAQPN